MRIIFLGSPSYAVHALDALVAAGYTIVGVVTQPDRPAGRDRRLTPPPVKVAALAHGLPVLQPETLRAPEVVETLRALQPDVGVVAAYGEILRRAVLEIPPLGYLNIHPSLLPLYRGPTPVAGAILAGETVTGVTIMRLDPGMDSGPILAQAMVDLPPHARTGPLTDELFRLGATLLVEVLPRYVRGDIELRPQDHSQATVTKMLKKEDGRIDWTLPAIVIERMTRAYDPWPSAYTFWRGQMLRIMSAAVAPTDASATPGMVISRSAHGHPLVQTGSDALELVEVQPASRRPMSGAAWLAGVHAPEITLG
jgi:methionyl-tRNA formyltransferase